MVSLKEYLAQQKVKKAQKKAGINPAPKPTGRVIDMRRTSWGHSIGNWNHCDETQTIRATGWCSPRPKVGDYITVRLKNQRDATFIFARVESFYDPPDMWKADLIFSSYGVDVW